MDQIIREFRILQITCFLFVKLESHFYHKIIIIFTVIKELVVYRGPKIFSFDFLSEMSVLVANDFSLKMFVHILNTEFMFLVDKKYIYILINVRDEQYFSFFFKSSCTVSRAISYCVLHVTGTGHSQGC